MTLIDDRSDVAPPRDDPDAPVARQTAPPPPGDGVVAVPALLRPAAAAALATCSAALVTGGIFGSWAARLLACAGALLGASFLVMSTRSRRGPAVQLLLIPAMGVIGLLSLVPGTSTGPAKLPQLVPDAIRAGRLLRPPVPFDPGWRPVLVVAFALVGFGAAWVATALRRPLLGVAVPLPILALTAITQPDDAQLLTGILGFVPLLGAMTVLYSGEVDRAEGLGRDFEIRRSLKGAAFAVPLIVGVVLLNNADFLFPDPVYDPTDKPQKPKPVPLSETEDRVLFEVEPSDPRFTGPWRIGVLDVYDGRAWRLPPFDASRFDDVPGNGVIDKRGVGRANVSVQITTRDLGDTAVLPAPVTPASIKVDESLVHDPRPGVFRVPEGRVPKGLVYTVALAGYPSAAAFKAAPAPKGDFAEFLEIPPAPPAVAALLAEAPPNRWERLDFLRSALFDDVVAAGQGVPTDVAPAKVADLLAGSSQGSPFEIVAAEAMLARWAGVPARLGFGFDGYNDEDGRLTLRPKNSAQWLEVYFEGFGWQPLIGTPPQAQASLDADPNARFNPQIEPSDDVAVEVYLPVELEDLRLLYERIRDLIIALAPLVVLLVTLYVCYPALAKQYRRRKRRAWAAQLGPRAQVGVEYAEFRDLATDLGIGEEFSTPLEFLDRLVEDDEHQELAWLVARAMHGDLARTLVGDDVAAAEELSESLRRRLWMAQPYTVRAGAFVARSSLRRPYTAEPPNVRTIELRAPVARQLRRVGAAGGRATRQLVKPLQSARRS